jgi:hypothetical protein
MLPHSHPGRGGRIQALHEVKAQDCPRPVAYRFIEHPGRHGGALDCITTQRLLVAKRLLTDMTSHPPVALASGFASLRRLRTQ